MNTEELNQIKKHLHSLEYDLQLTYQAFGKQTQEFTQKKNATINQLVDEIILTKQKIQQLEQQGTTNNRKKEQHYD